MSQKWQIVTVIVAAVLSVALTIAICWIVRLTEKANTKSVPVTITDTIVDWQHDTVYRYDTKVVKLPVHDTTTITDSVLVEVPLSKYYYDTTLTDTNRTIRMQATLSGYDVSIDTLAVTTTITPIIIKETMPWYKRFRPSIGVGIGSNLKGEASVGVFLGVGYLF